MVRMAQRPLRTLIRNAALLVGYAALLAAIACADAQQSAGSNGSGGVPAVTQEINASHALVLQEVFRVGKAAGTAAEVFYGVRGAAVDGEQRLFVLDGGNYRVAVFDSLGTFLYQFGGRGEGPGEFQRPAYFLLARDTAIVLESNRYRVHAFLADGTLISTQELRSIDPFSEEVTPPGVASSGWLIPLTRAENTSGEGGRPLTLHMDMHWFSPTGGGLGSPTGFSWSEVQEGRWLNGNWITPLFRTYGWWAVDGLGRIHVGNTGAYAWETYDAQGNLMARVSNRVAPVTINDTDVQQWKEATECAPGRPSTESCIERRQARLELPMPSTRPVVGAFRSFSQGHLAFLRADLDPNLSESGEISVWEFFDPEGRFLGRLERTLSPLWFDGRILIARERDDMEVETVVWYRVSRTE